MSNRDLLSRKQDEPNPGISRRELLLGLGGAAAAMAYAGNAVSAMPGHDHSKHSARLPMALVSINGKNR